MTSRQVKNTQTGVLSRRDTGKLAMERRILETVDRLFYQQGIRAVGVDTIAAEIGISKRTLYNYFPSKDALIVAYLSRRSRPISASDASAADQVFAVFDGLERVAGSDEFRGCPFVNAVAELGQSQHPARDVAIAFKEQRRMWFREMVTRLGVRDPETLATQLALLLDGAIAAALVRGEPSVARAAREAARALLRAGGARRIPSAKSSPGRRRRRSDHVYALRHRST